MAGVTIGVAATRTGWSARMLRYLERKSLVVPRRTAAGYRTYGLGELNQLNTLRELRLRFDVDPAELAFAARLRRDSELKVAVDGWLAAAADVHSWIEWEQRKHERLLAA
jgi:DNA-binding transcriptional MerR regulator